VLRVQFANLIHSLTPSSASIPSNYISTQVNAFGPIRVTTELTPLLKKSCDGRVINVSSYIAASDYDYLAENPDAPYPLFPHYRSSKQALNNWSREAALELKADGISLNVVNPGWVKTSMGGGDAVDSVLDGIQAALYLAVTSDPPSGEFLQRFEKEKPQEGRLQICTRSW
jgi:NAD(P)-dependent dehydrogenase (short-subunit alcohol dehydrogenase family)